ncbi:NigD-like protein [Prevotella sp. 10(H)]|uniref:NigD-like protein n=1 Tax=Prevotella sp. 10(H) TaxID=1158294 RepID=UPI00055AD9AB|nr:NigD-like protein [Prevotella sp. 10(H)]
MRRYRKLFSTLILCSVLALGFSSCDDIDGYSLGNFWEDIVTVQKIDENTYSFVRDNGEKLWVAAPVGVKWKPKYDRAVINFTILSDEKDGYDHYIRLNDYYDVLTKNAIYIDPDDKFRQDSIGNDPIKVTSVWEGGDYLNFKFAYNTGEKEPHMLNLVSAETDLSLDKDIVKLEFRHNVNKDEPAKYPVRGYVSFNLKPYKTEGRDKVTFEITWKESNGETKTATVEYKYTVDEPLDE